MNCWRNHGAAKPKPRAAHPAVETPEQWARRVAATMTPLTDEQCTQAARLLGAIDAGRRTRTAVAS
jgi:hypothetical protein